MLNWTCQGKTMIFKNLKNLKCYNDIRRVEKNPTVFVTEHLPKMFLDQRKLLMPYFKNARRNRQKTSWRAVVGEYVLHVDDKKVDLPIPNLTSTDGV